MYYVDWDQHAEPLPEPTLQFRASFHEEHTQPPAGAPAFRTLDDAENYPFLRADGFEGHYVGTGLSVHCTQRDDRVAGRDLGRWWEGDDWFVIDGERWPPTLHGTGTEDYFNLAYGFHRVDCRPEYGVTFLERPDPALIACGKFSMYRFHLSDPIPFESSIAASLEHGNFNLARVHYRSVAYWYGRPTDV